MKITEKINDIETSINQSKSFTIKASPKAFKILSSGLYSNKIRAIIRELSCNAYDAHIAANNPEPFIVHLPSLLDENFYVQDFGTGLSEEDIMSLYTTYFESNKTNSNDFVGALGLGSKSPFSYTDSFIVESRFKNKKTTYLVYINEEDLPSISKLEEVETDEHSGLTIKFSIKPEDINAITDESIKVLSVFEKQPKLIGANGNIQLHAPIEFNDKGYFIESMYGYNESRVYAYMGNILYPIQLDKLELDDIFINFIANQRLIIKFNIGDLDITPSREQLSYIKPTIKILRERIIQTVNDIIEDIVNNINSSENMLELINLFNDLPLYMQKIVYDKIDKTRNDYIELFADDERKIFNTKCDKINIENIGITGLRYFRISVASRRSMSKIPYLSKCVSEITYLISKNREFYISFNAEGDKLFKNNLISNGILISIRKRKDCSLNNDQIINYLEKTFFNIKINLASELEDKIVDSEGYIKYSRDMAFGSYCLVEKALDLYKISFNEYFREVNVIENDGKTFYLPLIDNKISHRGKKIIVEDFELYRFCFSLFQILTEKQNIVKIIFCRNRAIDYIKQNYNLPNFLDFIVRTLRKNKNSFSKVVELYYNKKNNNTSFNSLDKLDYTLINQIQDQELVNIIKLNHGKTDSVIKNLTKENIEKLYNKKVYIKNENKDVLNRYHSILSIINGMWKGDVDRNTLNIISILNLIYEKEMKHESI